MLIARSQKQCNMLTTCGGRASIGRERQPAFIAQCPCTVGLRQGSAASAVRVETNIR